MDRQEVISRLATLYGISEKDAKDIIGDGTDDEISQRISTYIMERIRAANPMNRKQRRALKKNSTNVQDNMELISDTSKKLVYIDLIQKLRKLNEKENKNERSS